MPSTTIQSIATQVLPTLEDLTGTFYTPTDIEDSVQDAYDSFLVRTGCYQKVVNIPFVGGNIYYNLLNTVGTQQIYSRLARLFSYGINRWLSFQDVRFLAAQRFDWELSPGTPWWAYIVNYQWLGFFPHYGQNVSNFDLFLSIGQDPLLTDVQVLQIPDQFANGIIFYTVADMLEQQGEYSKAMTFWSEYEVVVAACKKQVVNQMNPWIYEQLSALNMPEGIIP